MRNLQWTELLVLVVVLSVPTLLVVILVVLVRRGSGAAAPTAALPPGWYADPDNPAGLRFWDGRYWTEERARLEGPAA